MTPGAYIRRQREACGLSLEDVALMLDSTPPVSCRSRAELLGQIEDDRVPVSLSTAFALANVRTGVDLHELAELVDLHEAADLALHGAPAPRIRLAAVTPLWVNIGGEAGA